jgi:ectoine hydroxylase-related dioxygenase (phytanoyl-CoA dioxygenase family)
MDFINKIRTLFSSKESNFDANKLSVFKDKFLQEKFNDQGYLIIDLLSIEQVNRLLEYYNSLEHNVASRQGFHASLFSSDKKYVEKIHETIVQIIQPALEIYFKNYSIFLANYLVKEPSTNSIVSPHQDWNFVDEEKYYALNVWTALSDFNFSNGTMAIVPASQNIYRTYRGTANPYINTDFDKYADEIFKKSTFINLKAGQSIVYNTALLHASSPNQSDKVRIASGVGLIPESASLIHCVENQTNGEINVFEIDRQFLVNYPNSLVGLLNSKAVKTVRNPIIKKKHLLQKGLI